MTSLTQSYLERESGGAGSADILFNVSVPEKCFPGCRLTIQCPDNSPLITLITPEDSGAGDNVVISPPSQDHAEPVVVVGTEATFILCTHSWYKYSECECTEHQCCDCSCSCCCSSSSGSGGHGRSRADSSSFFYPAPNKILKHLYIKQFFLVMYAGGYGLHRHHEN